MSRNLSRRILSRSAAVVLMATACSSSQSDAGSVDSGASTGGSTSYTAAWKCEAAGTVTLDTVESCYFKSTDQTITFAFTHGLAGAGGPDAASLRIQKFTGPGTYATSGADLNTDSVFTLQGDPPAGKTLSGSTIGPNDASCSEHACTIEVTESSVVTAAVGAAGSFKGTVTCPAGLAFLAATGCESCAPIVPFHFDIADCARPE